MTAPAALRARLRRYPALGFLAVAALLASLLPSALRVPLSGPSTSAELAPVPGKSDSAQGDLSALGEPSTGELGAGSGLGGLGGGGRNRGRADATEVDPGDGTPDPGSGRNPAQKRCVGNPPRQTEDPLSPTCVAYFKGDNGGATAKGVTADEIVGVEWGGGGGSCSDEFQFFDYDDEDDPRRDPVTAAYLRYFNGRFQTYGRRVHLYGVVQPCSFSTSRYRAVLGEIEERWHPFFCLCGYVPEDPTPAEFGMITVARGPRRETTRRLAPFMLSYPPDHDDLVESAAEFVCARLAGRPARFAGDPTLQVRQRKFGFVYTWWTTDGIDWFTARVRERCGDAAGEVVARQVGTKTTHQEMLAEMRAEGVTTLVSMFTDFAISASAAGMGWYPEWFLPDELFVGDNTFSRVNWSAQGGSVFGISPGRRLGPPAEQPHRRAWREGCACGQELPTAQGAANTYNIFFLLFSGIQAAGPRLTPANLDKGLHALPARRSLDPFTPAAYFAPGNYSFVKDWAAMWWDPAGRPPGSNNVGCWRLVEDGLRYRAQDWAGRPGDDDIHRQNQPCQGDDS